MTAGRGWTLALEWSPGADDEGSDRVRIVKRNYNLKEDVPLPPIKTA